MNAPVRRALWINGLWLAAILVTFCGLVGGTAWRMQSARARVDELSRDLDAREARAAAEPDLQERRARLDAVTAVLDGWAALVDSEARRIKDVSTAAQAARITLVSLGSFQRGERADGLVRTSSHQLVSVGAFQQLARFLGALHLLPGMLSVDDIQLDPSGEGPGLLRASMLVTWNACGGEPLSSDGSPAP